MSNAWYDDLPEEHEQLYEESVRKIKNAVEKSFALAIAFLSTRATHSDSRL